jgi:hypothetical protein
MGNEGYIYQGFVTALWKIINRECMYTDLDLLDRDDAASVAKALRDVADDIIKDMEMDGEE